MSTPRLAVATLSLALVTACGGGGTTAPSSTTPGTSPGSPPAPVHVVLFTHVEDNTPAGLLSATTTRNQYVNLRSQLIQVGRLARQYNAKWSLQPDWKFLLAALTYEDAALRASTGGLNLLRYLRDSLGVAIDPHSHEGSGYNYTDVVFLLDSLGVGRSTVIGGHIWDPAIPQFQQWDRFRVPVRGSQYPAALWRGDILMGSGTPNHTNDPIVSGVWRPRNRNAYFEDDPAGNIAAIGAFRGDLAGISELSARYRAGQTPSTCMLTATMGLTPATITGPNGVATIENTIVRPVAALRDSGVVKLTDFSALIATWRTEFGAQACIHRISAVTR